jgi:aspartate/methionine/tyrosine aminotransferase
VVSRTREWHSGSTCGPGRFRLEPADLALTTGAFAAIMAAFRLLLDAGDEAIFSEPAWFSHEPMLLAADVVPRKVALKTPTFDLDLAAIDAPVGPRTRLVIVNTPHNPTGRIYSGDTLKGLSDLLNRASARIGHRIYLLSDEPYRPSGTRPVRMATGYSHEGIAEWLGIGRYTANEHGRWICQKLDVHNGAELVSELISG